MTRVLAGVAKCPRFEIHREGYVKKRFLDLICNKGQINHFRCIAAINKTIRMHLWRNGYDQFETPTLETEYGGATAKPFQIFLNSRKKHCYLNVAHELKLKQLLIGGYSKIFSLKSCFRNQDMDSTHAPEFTMLQCYTAGGNYKFGLKLVEKLICEIAVAYDGQLTRSIQTPASDGTVKINLEKWETIKFYDAFDHFNIDTGMSDDALYDAYLKGAQPKERKDFLSRDAMLMKVFDLCIEKKLLQPTHIIEYPVCSTSLAKKSKKGNFLERAESYIGGIQIANTYSEQNNPYDQLNVTLQTGAKDLTDSFCQAIKYSFLPNTGFGLGVTRLAMILSNSKTIRDVLLFPL